MKHSRGDPHDKAPRRLDKALQALPQRGNAPDNHPYLHSLGLVIFAIIWFALGAAVGHMRRGDNSTDGQTHGPYWDPQGNVPFREYVYEVNAWLNVTSGRMTPQAQAAAIQRGLGGLARTLAMRVPPDIINYGADIDGVHTDPVTYIMFLLSMKFERLEDERQLTSGTQLIDFHVPHGERIDVTVTRFEMARLEAQSVGF
ncbi:MAG: hypothetical protein GY813_20255, partial [Halieaceae bacterium]|nr:hypothetical protein [Halieaceae bacterium]